MSSKVQFMDSTFLLDEATRTSFLRYVMESFGCSYICLWSYQPHPSSCLRFLDGCYHEENSNQPCSSSGSLARRLFNEYCNSVFILENDISRVPGEAFKNCVSYMELNESQLGRMATAPAQMKFYQEARIKTAVFMGCRSGEIELGMSNPTMKNLEMETKNWFPEDFYQQFSPQFPQPADQNRQSSSSSRSMSMDSPEYPQALLFNIPNTSYIPEPLKEVSMEPALGPPSTTISTPHEQAMQALNQIRSLNFPSLESEHAAMTRAILAVISSSPPSSSSSSHHPPQHNYVSAFRNYKKPSTAQLTASSGRQSMLKRSMAYFKNLHLRRRQELIQGSHPSVSQLHHMISERKRREKLNESFHALRTLLPPGSKKDKASVLSGTREYLSSLKAQILELTQRNQALEAQINLKNEGNNEGGGGSSNERLSVQITNASEPTPEERNIDLQVTVRADCSILDLVIRMLDFLKRVKNVSLISMNAETRMAETSPINHVILRLKIEASEWDQSAFEEATRRVVADLAV
ncbi:hypothetical protein AAG906_009426 [Vitis piasezkii]